MQQRLVGRTGLTSSVIAMGCGPVAELMTGSSFRQQLAVVRQALKAGINWFDTAPGYGEGSSERALGECLAACDPDQQTQISTKVRLLRSGGAAFRDQIHRGLAQSLQRLRRSSVALLQLHNAITPAPDQHPFSVTPDEILAPGGIADCLEELRQAGLIRAIGCTGTGEIQALHTVLESGRFQTVQLPLNLLHAEPTADPQTHRLLAACQRGEVSVLAIRIFAAGALLGRPPGAHTLKTPFFPLSLYQRDAANAEQLCREWTASERLTHAVRFPLEQTGVSTAIVGFATPAEVLEVAAAVE